MEHIRNLRVRWIGLVAVSLALGVLGPASAGASPGSGSLIGYSGVLYSDCRDYDFAYNLLLPADTKSWNLEVDLKGPDGLDAGGEYLSSYGGDAPSGKAGIQLCGGLDEGGAYSLTGVLTVTDLEYNEASSSVAPAQFTLRLPRTKTKLTASDTSPQVGDVLAFVIKTQDERPSGYFATEYAEVKLQVNRGQGWVSLRGSKTTTDSHGKAKLRYRVNASSVDSRVRAVTSADDEYEGSTSAVLKVRIQH